MNERNQLSDGLEALATAADEQQRRDFESSQAQPVDLPIPKKRGRKPKDLSTPKIVISTPSERKSRTGSAVTYEFDDESRNIFPCPVCEHNGSTRAERMFHMRNEHPGYVFDGQFRPNLQISKIESPKKIPFKSPPKKKPKIRNPELEDVKSEFLFETVKSIEKENEAGTSYEPRTTIKEELDAGGYFHDSMGDVAIEVEVSDSSYMGSPHKSAPRNITSEKVTSSVQFGVPDGKYMCYFPGCDWRSNSRALRCKHMRLIHPDFELPNRFLRNHYVKTGVYMTSDEYKPSFSCPVEGCNWTGHYRASKSFHIRKNHPDYHSFQKPKASVGGYCPDGRYYCHVAFCQWRGANRTTRMNHMRNMHPDYIPPVATKMDESSQLRCFVCDRSAFSLAEIDAHIAQEHKLAAEVDVLVEGSDDFEVWMNEIIISFGMSFSKRRTTRFKDNVEEYHLVCRGSPLAQPMSYQESEKAVHYLSKDVEDSMLPNFIRSRLDKYPRVLCTEKSCVAHLKVTHNTSTDFYRIKGHLEHTGHRLGTVWLRMDENEREVFDNFLLDAEWEEAIDQKLFKVIKKIKEVEGFTLGGYKTVAPVTSDDSTDQWIGLEKFLKEQSQKNTDIFATSLEMKTNIEKEGPSTSYSEESKDPLGFTIGLMTEEMKKLWKLYGVGKLAVFQEEVILLFGVEVSVQFTLVFDEKKSPKCVAVVLTTNLADADTMFRQLHEVSNTPPAFLLSGMEERIEASMKEIYGQIEEVLFFFSWWSLLEYWATLISMTEVAKAEKFALLCVMRRLFRREDENFEDYAIEVMSALLELKLYEFLHLLDAFLTDKTLLLRSSFRYRRGAARHTDPTAYEATQIFLNSYLLGCETSNSRIDVFMRGLEGRVNEFNAVEVRFVPLLEKEKKLDVEFDEFSNHRGHSAAVEYHQNEDGEGKGSVQLLPEPIVVETLLESEGNDKETVHLKNLAIRMMEYDVRRARKTGNLTNLKPGPSRKRRYQKSEAIIEVVDMDDLIEEKKTQ